MPQHSSVSCAKSVNKPISKITIVSLSFLINKLFKKYHLDKVLKIL